MTTILHENQIIDTTKVAIYQKGADVCFTPLSDKHFKPMHFKSSDRAREVIELIASAIHCGDKVLDLDI